jgi:actin-related protein
MCHVVQDYELALKESEKHYKGEQNYELPDGRKILIGNERFKCPEMLFKP